MQKFSYSALTTEHMKLSVGLRPGWELEDREDSNTAQEESTPPLRSVAERYVYSKTYPQSDLELD